MATKTIPARTETICDVCQAVCSGSLGKGRRVQEGRLLVEQHALDYQGSPCARGDIEFDLCDDCLNKIIKALNARIEGIRNEEIGPESRSPTRHEMKGEAG